MLKTPKARSLFFGTFGVYARCFVGIFVFSLVDALARAVQLGAVEQINSFVYIVLEIFVWVARVGIVMVILGNGNILRWQRGVKTIVKYLDRPLGSAKKWLPIMIQLLAFGLLVFLLNSAEAYLAEWIAAQNYASFLTNTEAILFFLKNLTVIPFTLVFCFQTFVFMQDGK